MNNIYKVIWSKAKNCYVVASEIARSHTKSATGSEKIGGVTRRSLLASLMALSLLCGGLGVASAEVDVKVDVSSAPGAVEVYTKTGVDTLLADYGKKEDVQTNKDDITALQNTTTTQGNQITANTTQIANNTADIEKKIDKETAEAKLALKANATDVYTKADVNTELAKKADATSVFTKDEVNTKLTDYAKSDDVYTITAADGKFATSAALNTAKTDLEGEITTAKNELDGKITANTAKITANEKAIQNLNAKAGNTDATLTGLSERMTTAENNITNLKDADVRLEGKIDQNAHDITGLKDKDTELSGKIDVNKAAIGKNKDDITQNKNDITTINGKLTTAEGNIATNQNAIDDLKKNVGTVNNGTYLDSSKTVGENLNKLNDGLVKEVADRKVADTALSGRITANANTIAEVNQQLVNTNNHFNTELRNTNAALQAEGKARAEADAKINTKIGNIDDTRTAYVKDANSISQNLTTLDEKLQDTNDRTGGIKRNTEDTQTIIEDSVKVDKQGNVKDVNELSAKKITTTEDADLKGNVTLGTNAANTVTVNGTADFNEAVNMDKGLTVTNGETNLKKTKVDGDLKVTGTITTDKMIFGDKATNNYTEIDHGKVTSKNLVVNGAGETISSSSTFNAKENKVGFANSATGDQSFHKQTSDVIMDNVKDRDNSNNRTQTKTETKDIITDKDGNSSTTSQTASENKTYLKDKDGKNTNSTIDTAKGYDKTIKGENGETSTKQDELNITNTAKDGTITNDANHIENKANTMNTTVSGQATESYGGLNTTVNGAENHTVNGKQTNTVTEGQINNITGDQTTTITGNKNETVTENVTEDYKKNLTTTVGGNEIHDVKGTKTETVEGKLTENFKGGQETNVTGDQTTNVSGTQTTTATDIKRNASSGMIDTIDNDYGTNTETKVAGKTTTDVSIKGTGEEGKYIRGANESRDYLIKGTLKNSETKTVDATSTEITDGNGNTSATIQDVNNLAGSVTNGTETGVSGIHAKDNSVSIDSIVTDGNKSYSVINQKKGSIQSTVVDGTSSTVILQDKDNVTIASSNGMVGIVGKDIVNNAQDTITNTAGTSITNQVNDSKVTTDANGTTFENNTPAVSDGGATTTKINGNQITTGRVDANELGVSDKDGTNTADLSVKAGEGVKASASDGTTTGSLDVTADEVGSTVKDASGKGSTFKQRIDAIMMESKNVSIKAEETLTNEAKVITNRASEVINNEAININNTATGIIKSKASEIQNQADRLISNKVGENTWENMEDGKITTSIKNGTKQNLTQSDAEKTEHSVVNGSNSTVNKQTSEEITDAVTNGTTTNMTQNTATSSNNTIADKNGNANTVISTADGTSFINSKAAAPVTGASGAGTHLNTTIKGNTITTGKVTMDYADVMKDLGVHGNAKIDGKTTTDSLEVTGTSTLKGNVTMESDATVNGNFSVGGNTNLKNTEVDGTLNVTQKATFGDSVSIAKDLSVGGDVTANSYKVGGNTYIDANGINANDQKITNVADGSISEGSKDAVNGGQLYDVKRDMEHKVDKVGANAAAMANLRPMEFDPSSKWNIAAAIGNYGSETAAALGAFYRPNDDVMVNLSTAFGTGENMVGGGVSVRLGKGSNKLSREENNALKAQVADLTARMDALLSVLNPNMSKDFPDVPENHWAYEAVSRLAGNDIVQGYPDGEFHGERTMTRYEMAEIIYNALSRGAEAEKELVEEFKPELQAMAASEKATAERAEG